MNSLQFYPEWKPRAITARQGVCDGRTDQLVLMMRDVEAQFVGRATGVVDPEIAVHPAGDAVGAKAHVGHLDGWLRGDCRLDFAAGRDGQYEREIAAIGLDLS